MTLLRAPCQMQPGVAEAPFLDFQATQTLGHSQGMHIFWPCTWELRSLQGKERKAPQLCV